MKTTLLSDPQMSLAACDIPRLLRERLRTAVRRNPRFSLRAFAVQLGVDHSTLSQVLKGRRRLSARGLEAIGIRLGLSEEALRTYVQISRKKASSRNQLESISSLQFDLDTFQLLSGWHHFAILELIHVQGFQTDSRWIANTLGITVDDVNIALQRLLRLGLLEMSSTHRWKDKSGDAEFRSAPSTEAACNQVSQEIHELALQAVRRIPSRYRGQRHMVIAVDSKMLARLELLTEEFMKELRLLASASDPKDDVYQVEISFFPVTTLKKTRGEEHG